MSPLQRRWPRLAGILIALVVLAAPGTASAHNSFESSDPADGSTVATVERVRITFAKAAPLPTVGLDLIDPTGRRTALTPARGDTDRDVVAGFDPLEPGPYTVRWRLVGADGHVVSGRVSFTAEAAPASSTTVTPGRTGPAARPTTTTTAAPRRVRTADIAEPPARFSALTNGRTRWLLRLAGFVGLVAIGAALFVADATRDPTQLAGWANTMRAGGAALTVSGLGLLLAVTGQFVDGTDDPVTSGLAAVLRTEAGVALAVRAVAGAAWWRTARRLPELWGSFRPRAAAVGLLVATVSAWAFAGHARSMRWPWLGVPLDAAHHGAAALWLGGLVATIGVLGRAGRRDPFVGETVERVARLAAVCVAVLVVTGGVQALRLLGTPTALATSGHGRLLALKLVLLAAMLAVANRNRLRVRLNFAADATPTPRDRRVLTRAMATEFGVGMLILGVTAALVVTPPATA